MDLENLELLHNQIDHVIVLPDNVITAYTEPHRKYHDLDHLHYMINRLLAFYPNLSKMVMDCILWAIMYHDIVYHIPTSNDGSNEDLSAELFLKDHGDHNWAEYIAIAIRHTRTHILPRDRKPGLVWTITEHLIDLDLWALADEEAYLQNNVKIKAENGATDEEWIEGRSKWLEGFLERDQIFYTDLGTTREEYARRILEADLASLRS